jgi:hypothetical protein
MAKPFNMQYAGIDPSDTYDSTLGVAASGIPQRDVTDLGRIGTKDDASSALGDYRGRSEAGEVMALANLELAKKWHGDPNRMKYLEAALPSTVAMAGDLRDTPKERTQRLALDIGDVTISQRTPTEDDIEAALAMSQSQVGRGWKSNLPTNRQLLAQNRRRAVNRVHDIGVRNLRPLDSITGEDAAVAPDTLDPRRPR